MEDTYEGVDVTNTVGDLFGGANAAPSPAAGTAEAGEKARRQLTIEYITDRQKRHISFSKRKAGIMKKAYELSTLTGTQVLLVVVSETGLVYTYTTPVLAPLVTTTEGKDLMLACLGAPNPTPEQIAEMDARAANAEPLGGPIPASELDERPAPPRQVKRRKTVENMRSPREMQQPMPTMDTAFENARAHPSVGNLLEAYAARTPGQQCLAVDILRHYIHELDQSNAVLMHSGLESLEMVFDRIAQAGTMNEQVRGELLGFVSFIWTNGFITPQLHQGLARGLYGGITPPTAQPGQQQQQQRLAAIGAALSHYSAFVSLTYRGGVLGTDILEGMLLVQSVHDTFIIVEDPAAVGSMAPPAPPANTVEDTMLPLKLRIPRIAGQYIRPGDRLTLHIARLAHPAHHWAPTAFVSAHGPARGPNALSSEEHAIHATTAFQRERMERAGAENDEQTYRVAMEAYKRATRGEELARLGDLDDDGYQPPQQHQPPQQQQQQQQSYGSMGHGLDQAAAAAPQAMSSNPHEPALPPHLAAFQAGAHHQPDSVGMAW